MAIALGAVDGAWPTPVTTAAVTTASFSPAAGELIILDFCMDWADADTDGTLTPSNSGTALTWNAIGTEQNATGGNGKTMSWWAYNVSAQVGITATVTAASGTTNRAKTCKVTSYTGATSVSAVNSRTAGSSTTNNLTVTTTTTVNNSRIAGCAVDFNSLGVPTSTDDEVGGDSSDISYISVRKNANTATSGTSVDLNFDAAGASAASWGYKVFELVPANALSADATSTVTATRTAALALNETMSGTTTVTETGTAALALSRSASAAFTVTATLAAAITVTKTIDGTRPTTVTLTAALDQTKAITATATVTETGAAAMNVSLTSSATRSITEAGTAALALSRQADAASTVTVALTAAMAQTKVLAATETVTVTLAAAITKTVDIAGTLTVSAALTGGTDIMHAFPYSPLDIGVEFYINGAWVDVTNLRPTYECYVLGLDGMNAILAALERRSDQNVAVFASRLTFSMFDPNAVMDTDNALSPYYRQLGFGTQVRVTVGGEVIALGGVTMIQPDWSENDEVIVVSVEAKGKISLLETLNNPQESAMARALPKLYSPAGYWPMEDGANASVASSGLPNGLSMTVEGIVDLHTENGPAGSAPLCDGLVDDNGSFVVPDVVTDSDWSMSFIFRPGTGTSGLLLIWDNPTSEDFYFHTVSYSNEGGVLSFTRYGPDGLAFGATTAGSTVGDVINGQFNHIFWTQQQSGGNVAFELYINGVLSTSGTYADITGPPRNMRVAPIRPDIQAGTGPVSFGHLELWNGIVAAATHGYQAMLGFPLETAEQRLTRLALEDVVPFSIERDAIVIDTFARTVADGLGTPDVGGTYTLFGSGGSIVASDWDVTDGEATTVLLTTSSFRASLLDDVTATDVVSELTWSSPMPTGNVLEPGNILLRVVDINTYVMCRCELQTNADLILIIFGAGGSEIDRVTVGGFTYTEFGLVHVKAAAIGDQIMMRVWLDGDDEPPFWHLVVTDPATVVAGAVAWRNGRFSGNTNTDPVISVSNWSAYSLDMDSELVGPQPIGSIVELMTHAARVDGGILYDREDALEIKYRLRKTLYSQASALDLAYASSHLSPPFRPANDEVANNILVKRLSGGSARYIIPDGDFFHYSTEPPPDGANNRDRQIDINLGEDTQNRLHAAWHAHLNAWREKRMSPLVIELHRLPLLNAPEIGDALDVIRLGDVIVLDVANSPRWLPPDEMRMMVNGKMRNIAQFNDTRTINIRPADPYEVALVDTSGSELVVAISTSATSLKVATTLGPDWSTTDVPYYWQIGGEAMKVTAMAADTPAFIAAGTIANGNNASVSPGLPAGMTPDVGQSMFMWASIRNSGTGTPNAVSGWEMLVSSGNVALYHRYYVTGDAAPTVTFTGGVANADTQARIFGFSGLSKEFASGTKAVPAAHAQLNSSAQNVAYAALPVNRTSVAMIFAWKQDDATGYASPSGFTEMADNSTTTGDDSSIAAYYDLTAANNASTGSITVTGGASAISRSVIAAFRPTYTATVERSVNGVSASHAVGDSINGWRMGVVGL